jgi:predicted Zn-dependent peptidase
VRFGAHQNAYTSFDVTCYELHVPLDGTDLLERGLQVLRQLVSATIIHYMSSQYTSQNVMMSSLSMYALR